MHLHADLASRIGEMDSLAAAGAVQADSGRRIFAASGNFTVLEFIYISGSETGHSGKAAERHNCRKQPCTRLPFHD